MNTTSPCLQICELDDLGVCRGCARSLAEIACWSRLTDPEKSSILARLAALRDNTPPPLCADPA